MVGVGTDCGCAMCTLFALFLSRVVLIRFVALLSQEDIHVLQLVTKHGTKKWSLIGSFLDGRTGKQCRERYILPIVCFFVRTVNNPCRIETGGTII